jgi:FAD/FMN-containing dehydrogenase
LQELAAKKSEQTLEGHIYRAMHALIEENGDEIERARPTVTKNSAGYYLWNVLNEEKSVFDLTQLVCGSQGTLALITRAKLGLVAPKPHHAMLVIFITGLDILPEVVSRVLSHEPESFESYDDKTFSLAVRFMPQMLRHMGMWQAMKLGFSFIPEVLMAMRGGVPKLILLAQFAENTAEEALEKVLHMRAALSDMSVETRIARNEAHAEKYWKVRREAFSLLRKNMHGLYAAPFIDDFSIHPQDYPRFLPELSAILDESSFTYAIQGHVGDGNFHIFPLADMSKQETHRKIMELMPKVFALVHKYGGSITGEHNDGIIRTPFLSYQFSPKMLDLFAEVKRIWDPNGIFNPSKKVGGTIADIERSMINHD